MRSQSNAKVDTGPVPDSRRGFSRYHVASRKNQPPNLEAIFKSIAGDKSVRRRGFLNQKNDARGIMGRVDPEYNVIGKADDLWRFLLNYGVLVEGPEGFWYDERRATIVLQSCGEVREPGALHGPDAQRIATIKSRRARKSASREEVVVPLKPPLKFIEEGERRAKQAEIACIDQEVSAIEQSRAAIAVRLKGLAEEQRQLMETDAKAAEQLQVLSAKRRRLE
ncbi:MAG: hypothetical protein WA001_03525 [Patescibacteria group bacterium]